MKVLLILATREEKDDDTTERDIPRVEAHATSPKDACNKRGI
jgi:hypothetical protein